MVPVTASVKQNTLGRPPSDSRDRLQYAVNAKAPRYLRGFKERERERGPNLKVFADRRANLHHSEEPTQHDLQVVEQVYTV